MKIAIFGNEYQPQHAQGISRLLWALQQNGVETIIEIKFHSFLVEEGLGVEELPAFDAGSLPEVDMAMSLGGDGTFLTTVMWVGSRQTPIVGINTGHLGYLTAYRLDEAETAVRQLLASDYSVEARTMLEVKCDDVEIHHPYALNEIAILRHDTSAMLKMHTSLSNTELTTYQGDGLIVSTPTGSTAYNLSAGGPIISPAAQCVVLSPLSPHSLTMRPLVVPDDAVVSITTHSRAASYQMSIDGEVHVCPEGTTVTVRKAPFQAMVVQPRGRHFAMALREKLLWGT